MAERRIAPKQLLLTTLGVGLFCLALWILFHELRRYSYREVMAQARAIPASALLLACGLTAASYLLLSCYDLLALRYLKKKLGFGQTLLTSFIAYVFSNNVGLSVLGGGAVRYRLYTAWGLSALETGKVVIFCAFTFWFGVMALCGVVFVLDPLPLPKILHLPFATVRPLGVAMLIVLVLGVVWFLRRREPLRFRDLELPVPSPGMLGAQVLTSMADLLCSAGVFYALVRPHLHSSYAQFLGDYLLALLAALISHVPGGLGVFETVILLTLGEEVPGHVLMGALLVYRAIYYLAPLATATSLLGWLEWRRSEGGVRRAVDTVGSAMRSLTPHLLAVGVFCTGLLMLFSGVTPGLKGRLNILNDYLPLTVIEVSHFLASVVGILLLILARGIQRRLDGAYQVCLWLLAAGALLALVRGGDVEEAVVLFSLLVILLPCRKEFYRRSSLLAQRFSWAWMLTVVLALVCALCLGNFVYRHFEYSQDMWWHFSLHGNAPRFMRALVGASCVALLWSAARLLRLAPPQHEEDPEGLAKAAPIALESPHAQSLLVFLGDKQLLFNREHTAFIMYAVQGRSWVVMGDPVGPSEAWPELLWEFRELCYRNLGRPVFYQVDVDYLHLYLDLGLTLVKIGEEAVVDLPGFDLEGSRRRGLRRTQRKLAEEGCRFAVIDQEQVEPLLPELRRVSDAWLAEKHAAEKSFSLGAFAEPYLCRFPMALVWHGDRLVAFANLWTTGPRHELSLDLMRYRPDAPDSIMEYLILELLLWGRAQGYQRFCLGMAPLSGLDHHELAPLWNRFGNLLFRHGEHFYNFQGLRQYKEKFSPVWRPRYLALPRGLALPAVVADIAILIAGGVRDIVRK